MKIYHIFITLNFFLPNLHIGQCLLCRVVLWLLILRPNVDVTINKRLKLCVFARLYFGLYVREVAHSHVVKFIVYLLLTSHGTIGHGTIAYIFFYVKVFLI